MLPALNGAGADEKKKRAPDERKRALEEQMYGRGHVERIYRAWLEEMNRRSGPERRAAQNLTLGYVTSDVRIFVSRLLDAWTWC